MSLRPVQCPLCPWRTSKPRGDTWVLVAERNGGELCPSPRSSGCDRHPGRRGGLVSHERAGPLLRGARTGAGTPVCWCRAAAPGLFGVGEWEPRDGRCPWWVLVTAPCPSALPRFGQHRCVSAASVLESLTGSLRGSAQHRAGSCPGKPRAAGSAKIMLAAGADLGMPGRQCRCQSRQRG